MPLRRDVQGRVVLSGRISASHQRLCSHCRGTRERDQKQGEDREIGHKP